MVRKGEVTQAKRHNPDQRTVVGLFSGLFFSLLPSLLFPEGFAASSYGCTD